MFFTKNLLCHISAFSFKNMLSTLSIILLSFLVSSASFAQEGNTNAHISFEKPWIRLLPPTIMHTAGYVTIKNSSDTQDTLLNVWSPTIDSLSVHQTKEVDGVFKMLAAKNLVVAPKSQLEMKPGGYHLMMMGLETPLTDSSEIMICFEFEKAGIVHVIFPSSKTAP